MGLTIAAMMQGALGALHRVSRNGLGYRGYRANSGSRRRSPCTQDRYRGPRMDPHLHRAGSGYDEVGVALFYGGLVRSKHILGTIMQSVVMLCLVSLIWDSCRV